MSDTTRYTATGTVVRGRAGLPAGALDGVRTRRFTAFCLDFVLVSLFVAVIYVVLTVATFGLALFILPPLWPIVAFFYNGVGVSGARMGTPGMRAAGLEMRMDADGTRVPFISAAIHGVLLYLSWMVPPIFLVSLVAEDKRCLHDMLAGLIVVRRLRA